MHTEFMLYKATETLNYGLSVKNSTMSFPEETPENGYIHH